MAALVLAFRLGVLLAAAPARAKHALLVVASADNGQNIDRSPIYPASYGDSNIPAVAASTSADTLASFSN